MEPAEVGKILQPGEQIERDAIHVAIIPVIADMILYPGQSVGVCEKQIPKVDTMSESVGIVDPFLKDRVFPGQWFYLFLFPRTASNLRHNWSHPAFFENTKDIQKSIEWLKDFAQRYNFSYENDRDGCYEEMMRTIKVYLDRGTSDRDCWHGIELDNTFWDHVEAVLDQKIVDYRTEYIPCSC